MAEGDSNFTNLVAESVSVTNTISGRLAQSYTAYTATATIANTVNVALLNNATAGTFTLATPAAGEDGLTLTIVNAGILANVVAVNGGANGGGTASDVATFATVYGGALSLIAINNKWYVTALNSCVLS